MTVILLLLTSFVSAFIQSTTGFGYAIMFMAITPYFLPYNVASVLSLATSPVGNVANVFRRIKNVNWKQVIIPMLFATASTYIAIELTKSLELATMRRILGCLLFFLAIWFMFFSGKVKIKPTLLNCAIAGLISGTGGGLFSISGPPMVVYYLSALKDKEEYMATIQTYFFFNNLVTIGMRIITGTFPSFSVFMFFATVAGLLSGVALGHRVYSKLNGDAMKKYVYGFMALSGLWIVING